MALDDKQAQALIDAALGANKEAPADDNTIVVETGNKTTEAAKDEGDSSLYDWSDSFSDDEGDGAEEKKDEKVIGSSDSSGGEDGKSAETESKPKEWWQQAAEELGMDVNSKEDFIEKSKPREVFVDERDPNIRKLKSYVSMSDEDLVREDKKARGWSSDKIEKYINRNSDNLEFEAEDIRSTLNSAMQDYSKQQERAAYETQAESKARIEKLNLETKNYLSKTEEVLGFKVGKDEAATTKWRQGMEKYLTSGNVFKDIDAIVKDASEGNVQKLVELAQFLKGRDGIMKGLIQKGKSQESEKFLRDLENSGEDTTKGGERMGTDKKKNLDAWVI